MGRPPSTGRTGVSASAGYKVAGAFFIGVDAGGTYTRAVLMTSDGAVLGQGQAGPANYRTAPIKTAAQAIQSAVRQALEQAQAIPKAVTAVSIGCSGMEGPGEASDARALVGDVVTAAHYFLDTDVYTGLVGALNRRPGIFTIAGTGSIALGLDSTGRRVRAGGWGNRFGDEGSALWIATEAIKEALKTADGRSQALTLWRELQEFTGVMPLSEWHLEKEGVQVTSWLYAQERHIADIAAFAPHVQRIADMGDKVAQAILRRAGAALAELVTAIARQLQLEAPVLISCSGGVWRHNPYVRSAFFRALDDTAFSYTFQDAIFPAEVGAVFAAMDALGIDSAQGDHRLAKRRLGKVDLSGA